MADKLLSDDTLETSERTSARKSPDKLLGDSEREDAPGFDLFAWMNGLKPVRRSVTLYARLDLLAERDAAGDDLKEARQAGDADAVKALRLRIGELTEQILASRMRIILQGVSGSKFNEILEEAKADRTVRTANDVLLYQIAAQIVEPAGLGWEQLKELDDVIPTQTANLATAWTQINTTAPDVEATVPL